MFKMKSDGQYTYLHTLYLPSQTQVIIASLLDAKSRACVTNLLMRDLAPSKNTNTPTPAAINLAAAII